VVLTGATADDPDAFLSLSGERYDAAALVDVARDTAALELQNPRSNVSSFLLEERIRPHPDLAELVGPTLCSDGSPSLLQLPAPRGLMDGELKALYEALRRGRSG
jgi:hypothetical protein